VMADEVRLAPKALLSLTHKFDALMVWQLREPDFRRALACLPTWNGLPAGSGRTLGTDKRARLVTFHVMPVLLFCAATG
jgi:hypothetical protein